jgi:hypothetical protein
MNRGVMVLLNGGRHQGRTAEAMVAVAHGSIYMVGASLFTGVPAAAWSAGDCIHVHTHAQ